MLQFHRFASLKGAVPVPVQSHAESHWNTRRRESPPVLWHQWYHCGRKCQHRREPWIPGVTTVRKIIILTIKKKKTPQTQKTEETEECSLFVTEAVRQTSEKLSLFYLDSHDFVICAFFVFLSFMSNFDTSCKLTDVLML